MSRQYAARPGCRVALADYDERRLSTLSRILRGYAHITGCTGYQNGEDLLRDLEAGEGYKVILLGRALLDMEVNEFFVRFHSLRLPYSPVLVLLTSMPGQDALERSLLPLNGCGQEGFYQIETIRRIVEAFGYSQEDQIEELCARLYREWRVTSESRNCEHLTRLLQQAVRNPRENDLRKGLMIPVQEQCGISVYALESGLARVRDEAEAQCTPAWQELLRRWGVETAHRKKLEPKEFIRIVRSELLCRVAQSWKESDDTDEMCDPRSPVGG